MPALRLIGRLRSRFQVALLFIVTKTFHFVHFLYPFINLTPFCLFYPTIPSDCIFLILWQPKQVCVHSEATGDSIEILVCS